MTHSAFLKKNPIQNTKAMGRGCLRPSDTLSWLSLQRMNHQKLVGISRIGLHNTWGELAFPWSRFCLLATEK